jgi:hypothetical protein
MQILSDYLDNSKAITAVFIMCVPLLSVNTSAFPPSLLLVAEDGKSETLILKSFNFFKVNIFLKYFKTNPEISMSIRKN